MYFFQKHSITKILKKAVKNSLDFVYPPLCILCNTILRDEIYWLCMECKKKLLKNNRERECCLICAMNKKKHSCSCDKFSDFYFTRAFSFFDYDRAIHDLIHQLKYKNKSRLAYYFGKEFACLIPDDFLGDADGIIPVPLHFLRQMQRGYNQADFFARGIVQSLNHKIPYMKNVLKRIKYTKTQTKLNKIERYKNLANAFMVNPGYTQTIKNKKLILVDDVITTGATTSICSEVLSIAGAKRTYAISIARG